MEENKPVSNPDLGSVNKRAVGLLKRVQATETIKVVPETTPAPVIPPTVLESKPKEPDVSKDYDINPPKAEGEQVVTPDTKKEAIPKEYVPEDPTDEVDSLIDPRDTTGANFKKLRTKLKSVTQERKDLAEKAATFETKVREYEEGVAIPEIVQRANQRIAELEPFEKLYKLKELPAYQEKVTKPLQAEQKALAELAAASKVDTALLTEALRADNIADSHRILKKAFNNEVSALEAATYIKNIKKIHGEAASLEKDVGNKFDELQADSIRIMENQRMEANERIVATSKSAWSQSLGALRQDSRFSEITYRDGDTEHNEKFVRPILTKAGQEYGMFVRRMAENGLKNMPVEDGIAIARAMQLAHYTGVAVHRIEALETENRELKERLGTRARVNYPSVNGTGDRGVTSSGSGAVGAQRAGANVLARVQGK